MVAAAASETCGLTVVNHRLAIPLTRVTKVGLPLTGALILLSACTSTPTHAPGVSGTGPSGQPSPTQTLSCPVVAPDIDAHGNSSTLVPLTARGALICDYEASGASDTSPLQTQRNIADSGKLIEALHDSPPYANNTVSCELKDGHLVDLHTAVDGREIIVRFGRPQCPGVTSTLSANNFYLSGAVAAQINDALGTNAVS